MSGLKDAHDAMLVEAFASPTDYIDPIYFGGSGMTVTAQLSTAFNGSTLQVNRNYLIDFSAAVANANATLPAGATGAVLQISPFGMMTDGQIAHSYRATVTAAGSDKIYYNGTLYDALTIQQPDYGIFLYWDNTSPTTRWVAMDWPTQDASIIMPSDYNICLNPNDSLLGWAAVATGAVTTDTATTPLGPVVQTAIKISGSATNDYAHYRFTMPDALKQRKLAVEWWQIAAALTSGDFKVDLYTNSSANYDGTATRVALSTDSSAVSSIANLNGQYRTSWDADSSSYYELRIVRTGSGAKSIYLAGVMIGMRNVLQGAAVGEWQSFTPTGSWSTNVTYSGRYRRVGSDAELIFQVDASGTPSGASTDLYFTLPTGMTINTSALTSDQLTAYGVLDAIGSFRDATGVGYLAGARYRNTTTVMATVYAAASPTYPQPSDINSSNPVSWASGDWCAIKIRLPIAEWAGSGTVNVVQNDVEYAASTTGTWDAAAAAANTIYGPAGAPISGALAANRNKVVRFQTHVQPTDMVTLEFYVSGQWVEQSSFAPWVSTQSYDFGAVVLSGSGTDVTVTFFRYQRMGSTYNTLPGQDWGTGYYWRLRKISGGQAVGFGMASATSAGLVPNYETGTISVPITGAWSSTETWSFTKVGKVVTLHVPGKTASASASTLNIASGTLPSRLRPVYNTYWPVNVYNNNNSTTTPGVVYLAGDGSGVIARDLTMAAFTGSAVGGYYAFSISYMTA